MGRLVLDDLGCAHLPEWRAFRMVLTWFAGGVGPLLQHRDIAVRALDARGGEARFVGRQNLHAVDETVAKIITKREPASKDDVAMLVRVDDQLILRLGLRGLGGGGRLRGRRSGEQLRARRNRRDRQRQRDPRGPLPAGIEVKGRADGKPHQPSSCCNNTYTPNMQPTIPGDHPATEALRNPAPPRSLTTFVAT